MRTSQHLSFCLLISAILPLATSCRKEAASGDAQSYACFSYICLSRSGGTSCFGGALDAFVYEDDGTGRLDSYSRSDADGESLEIPSRSGRKHFVVVANARDDLFVYNDIMNYDGLGSVYSSLSGDNPESPLMSGEADGRAGAGDLTITLRPLMAQVRVNSFFADFIGKPYSGMEFEHPRAYLTNVNGMCPVLGGPCTPVEILNQGRLDNHLIESLPRPDMLVCDGVTDHPLYCYPCDGTQSAPGLCTTRLVIEGEIGGVTYYYPIDVGNGIVGQGLSYVYDITITRPGMTDPDIPIDPAVAKVEMHIENWEEYDNETIYY